MKKYILLIIILVLALGATVFYALKFYKNESNNFYYSGEWRTYKNEKHGYSIDYPSYLNVSESEDKSAVSFMNSPEPANLSIWISTSTLLSIDEWLEQNPTQRLEKRITVGGYDGAITHYISIEGDVIEDKIAALLKDGTLFKIGTFFAIDPDRILNSFKFE